MENLILIVFIAYTLLLFLVAHLTSRKSSNNTFFTGNMKSPWFVVAYGMIGASLSGVTFMSVPGGVYSGQFTYFGIVVDDRHNCIINVTQEQIQKLKNVLKKELSSYDRSMFHESPDNHKLLFNNSLCKYDHNSRFLEYNCDYWECMRLLKSSLWLSGDS